MTNLSGSRPCWFDASLDLSQSGMTSITRNVRPTASAEGIHRLRHAHALRPPLSQPMLNHQTMERLASLRWDGLAQAPDENFRQTDSRGTVSKNVSNSVRWQYVLVGIITLESPMKSGRFGP